MKETIQFNETQKFTQWWLWLFLLLPFFLIFFKPIYLFLNAFQNSGNASFSLVLQDSIWWGIILYSAVLGFFWKSKLYTVVTKEEVQIKHLIFFRKVFRIEDIAKAEIVNYGFVGYGIRLSINYGTVYNVKGNKGLALTLKNGKKYTIGTQKPIEFYEILKKLLA